jgi:hypothetical protein
VSQPILSGIESSGAELSLSPPQTNRPNPALKPSEVRRAAKLARKAANRYNPNPSKQTKIRKPQPATAS